MNFIKIKHITALKELREKRSITVCPSECSPNSVFSMTIEYNEDKERNSQLLSEKWRNSFKYYNCNDETGNSISYYKKI